MQKNVAAVFYDFKYYILTDENTDLSTVKDGDVLSAKRLKEERCMAPDFIYESICDEDLTVSDRQLLFPVTVNLYSGEEYDKMLWAQVNKVCPGCRRYTDDGVPELNGHHREISLEGICYEREEEDEAPTLADRVYWFCLDLAEHLNELADCIEKGADKKFDKICRKCAAYLPVWPRKFSGGKKDGQYCLYMQSGLGSEIYYATLAYISLAARDENYPLANSGWTFYPYVPEGVEGYKGKIKDGDPMGFVSDTQGSDRWLNIRLFHKNTSDKKRNSYISDFYDYLSYKIGENAVIRTVDGYDLTDRRDGILTAAEIAGKISEKDGKFEDSNSFPESFPVSWENSEAALPYKRTAEGITACYSLSSIGADKAHAQEVDFRWGIAYAYVFIPASEGTFSSVMHVINTYFSGEKRVPEPVLLKDDYQISFMPCGCFVCSEEGAISGVALDFFVTHEKSFYRFVKILAPVLSDYGAKLVVVNGDGTQEYNLGYRITPVDGDNN